VAAVAVLFFATSVKAKPVTDTCTYIKDGTLLYATGHYLVDEPLTLGYDIFGYNYQAHIFNGTYANAYLGRPGSGLPPYTGDDTSYMADNLTYINDPFEVWQFRNVQLQMKWNDAWLANKDCNEDGVLDRPSPVIGSGAWLTNHASGTYTSKLQYDSDITGTWNFDVVSTVWPGTYPKTMTISQDLSGNITGTGYNAPSGNTWTVTGNIAGSVVNFSLAYDAPMTGYIATFIGSIQSDGTMSGTWSDVMYGDTGAWTSTSGEATKLYKTCTVSEFVKIVAVPEGATQGLDKWYTAEGAEIGPAIWGSYAIIQDIASDPCDEYGVVNYMSPLKKGLGAWK